MPKFSIFDKDFTIEQNTRNSNLLPWSSADIYLLNKFVETNNSDKIKILILNDNFGALSIPLNNFDITLFTDSYLSLKHIEKNFLLNNLNFFSVKILKSTFILEKFQGEKLLSEKYDFVLLKIPKSIPYLKYQIMVVQKLIKPEGKIFAAGMTKHLSPNLTRLFEERFGKVKVEKTYKKSVLFNITPIESCLNIANEKESTFQKFQTEMANIQVAFYPNVFSQGKVDNGTRFLLKNISIKEECRKIIDLGCGNGIIAAFAKKKFPEIEVIGVDESYLAIKSAETTFKLNNLEGEFFVADGLEDFAQNSYDLVLSNPPFHLDNTLDKEQSKRLFESAYNVLTQNGEFFLVCNKSLNYSYFLKKHFNKVEKIAQNDNYMIIKSVK